MLAYVYVCFDVYMLMCFDMLMLVYVLMLYALKLGILRGFSIEKVFRYALNGKD